MHFLKLQFFPPFSSFVFTLTLSVDGELDNPHLGHGEYDDL